MSNIDKAEQRPTCIWSRFLCRDEHPCSLFCHFLQLRKTYLCSNDHLEFAYTQNTVKYSMLWHPKISSPRCDDANARQNMDATADVENTVEHQEASALVHEYRSQQSEPPKISDSVLQQLKAAPTVALNRSVSYQPKLKRQNSFEFNLTDSEKRKLFRKSSSSGYETWSKPSFGFSVEEQADETPEQADETLVKASHGLPLYHSSSGSFNDPVARGRPEDRNQVSTISAMARKATLSLGGDVVGLRRTDDSDETVVFTIEEFHLSDEPSALKDHVIPTFVEQFSLTPPQSLAVTPPQSLSLSDSVELSLVFYETSVDETEMSPSARVVSSSEIEHMAHVPDIEAICAPNKGTHYQGSKSHHDYAMSVFEMKYHYDYQLVERRQYSDSELNALVDRYVENSVRAFVMEQIMQGKPLHEIEDYLEQDSQEVDLTQERVIHDSVVENYWVKSLRMAMQCHVTDCTDFDCAYGQHTAKVLQQFVSFHILAIDHSKALHCRAILRHIYDHAQQCEEPCVIPFCDFFRNVAVDSDRVTDCFADVIQVLKQEYFPASGGCVYEVLDKQEADFIQCDEGYSSLPEQDVGYHITTRLDVFKDVFLAIGQIGDHALQVLARKRHKQSSLDVLAGLKQLGDHAHVIKHLWAARTPQHCLTCTSNEGDNLRTVMQTRTEGRGFSLAVIKPLLHQLDSILQFLHSKILFLNWSSDHVLLSGSDVSTYRLLLVNFAHSFIIGGDNSDAAEQLEDHLPVYLLPPEVLSSQQLSVPNSDLYGVGCLVYELAVGKHLYSCVRHENRTQQLHHVTHYPDRDIATVRDVDFGLHDLVKCLLDDNPTSRCFDVASVYNH